MIPFLVIGAALLGQTSKPLPPVDSVRIERTPCFGRCPIYRATLYRNGTVRYFGERFVDKLGAYKGRLSEDAFPRISMLVDRLGFNSLKARYEENITDLPSCTVTVIRGRQVKSVYTYGVLPDEMWAIQMAIDRVIEDSRDTWTFIPPDPMSQ